MILVLVSNFFLNKETKDEGKNDNKQALRVFWFGFFQKFRSKTHEMDNLLCRIIINIATASVYFHASPAHISYTMSLRPSYQQKSTVHLPLFVTSYYSYRVEIKHLQG